MKVVLNLAGFQALRTDPAVMDEIGRQANAIADLAGAGYEVDGPHVTGGRVRARASVFTATPRAMVDNATHNTLLKALGGTGMVDYTSKAGKTSRVTQAQYDNYTRGKK